MAYTSTHTIKVANSTTQFGKLLPAGVMVFDTFSRILYQLTVPTIATTDTIDSLLAVITLPAPIERISANIQFDSNYIQGDEVQPNTMVTVNGYTSISNKITNDISFPQNVGSPAWVLPDIPAWPAPVTEADIVRSGHFYTINHTGWLQGIRLWVSNVSATTTYNVVYVSDPNGATPVFRETGSITNLTPNQWNLLATGKELMASGAELLVYIEALDYSLGAVILSDQWTYDDDSSLVTPATTEWNTRNNQNLTRVNEDGVGGNHAADFTNCVAGTIWRFTEVGSANRWIEYVQTADMTDQGTHWQFNRTTDSIGPFGAPRAGELCDVVATSSAFNLTEYVESTTYWSVAGQPDFATVEGRLDIGGVPVAGKIDSAFGIDIQFQKGTQSPDWDVIANISSDSTGVSTVGFVPDYKFSKIVNHTVVSTGPTDWDSIGSLAIVRPLGESIYEYKFSMSWNLNSTTTSAFMRFSTDNGTTWSEFQSEPKDITDTRALFYAFPKEYDLAIAESDTVLVECAKENGADVMVVEFLDIIFQRVK